MGYRRIVALLVTLGLVPAGLLSAIGVLLLVVGEAKFNLLMGILVLTFTGTFVTGTILVWVFLRRERNLSQLQNDFISKVSHEVRTPLTSIRMFTETLKLRRGDREMEDKAIAALESESLRLSAMIDRLLNWGRMESGMREYECDLHDVRGMVEQAIDSFAPTRDELGVTVTVDVPEGLPKLYCDRDAIVDCLVNLLSNAYKYASEPRSIHVSAREERGRVLIAVKDNGIGIPRTEQRRIFLKFYRVDDKLTRKQPGSGLGLSIVQHIARAHLGRVDVQSHPGEGSTFTLNLPQSRPVSDVLLQEGRGGQRSPSERPRAESP